MTQGRATTIRGVLLHAQPYRETAFLCTLYSAERGRVRCELTGRVPEHFREFELKLTERNHFIRSAGFRYLEPLLITDNQARLQGMYVNELLFRLAPPDLGDTALYGACLSTLHHLQQQHQVPAALRFFERQLLLSLGQQVDFNHQQDGAPIAATARYQYVAQQGFIRDNEGRYQGQQVLAAGRLDFSVSGALAVARECQQQQLNALLNGQTLHSQQWFTNRGS